MYSRAIAEKPQPQKMPLEIVIDRYDSRNTRCLGLDVFHSRELIKGPQFLLGSVLGSFPYITRPIFWFTIMDAHNDDIETINSEIRCPKRL